MIKDTHQCLLLVSLEHLSLIHQQAVESVRKLLGMAKDYIPEEKWSKTPLTLKATAGLRLLPGTKAEAILEGVSLLCTKFSHLGHCG